MGRGAARHVDARPDANAGTMDHAVSRAFDQTMTAFYNVLKRRFGDTHDDADLGSCAAELAALGTVRPLIDGASGKVLGYECSIVTEKL